MQQEEVLVLQNGFERGFCCVHPATLALPPGWAVSLRALRSAAALGSTLCPICARQRDPVSSTFSPSSRPLQRALLTSCFHAALQPRAEQTPRSPAPERQLCACPASECPWCL